MAVANGTQDLWQDAEESRSLLEVFAPSWAWWCKGSTDRVSDGREYGISNNETKTSEMLTPTNYPNATNSGPLSTCYLCDHSASEQPELPSCLDPTLF